MHGLSQRGRGRADKSSSHSLNDRVVRHVKPNFFVSRAPFLRIVPEERGSGRMEIEIERFLSGFSGVLPDSLLNRESRGKIKREPLGLTSFDHAVEVFE